VEESNGHDEDAALPVGQRYEHGRIVPHLTVEQRVARGKAARREVPREAHSSFSPSSGRHDPVDLLERQATSRLPELVPIRYGRMLISPFTFYRGAALVMASDLAAGPRSGITTQLSGDAHLMNFGAFGSPERQLVFGINDFDETLPGPWEWDVKRLAASFAIAGRDDGYSTKERRTVLMATVGAYRRTMREFAAVNNLTVWYAHLDIDQAYLELQGQLDHASRKRAQASIAKARARDSTQAYNKLTHVVDGERRIISDPPLIQPVEELVDGAQLDEVIAWIRDMLGGYRRTLQSDRRELLEDFRFVDLPARSSASAVSVPEHGSCCCSAGTRTTLSFCKSRKRKRPCWRSSSSRAATVPLALVSCMASTSCKRPATSSSATSACWLPTAWNATSTSANSETGRVRRSWSR